MILSSNFFRRIILSHNKTYTPRFSSSTTFLTHKPPLERYGIPARYANAVYSIGCQNNTLDTIRSDLQRILPSLNNATKFYQYCTNPLISRNHKINTITDILSSKVNPTTLNLLTTLAGNNKLPELKNVIDIYEEYMMKIKNVVKVKVISVEQLTKKEKDNVLKAINIKNVDLEMKVDQSIVGGLIIEVGNKVLDCSVKSKIDEIEKIGKA
jgi:F-type H+-transporting ATPase subunit O